MRILCMVSFFIGLLAACGSQDKASQPAPQAAQWQNEVPQEILAKVPKYLIERTNYETGVVEYAYTNEPPQEVGDLSTEEGRLAYGKSEAERFARATPVAMKTLEGDEDVEMLKSSESFFFGGLGGFGFGLGGFGFGFGGLGCGGFGGFGYRGFGLGGMWGGGCFGPCGGFW